MTTKIAKIIKIIFNKCISPKYLILKIGVKKKNENTDLKKIHIKPTDKKAIMKPIIDLIQIVFLKSFSFINNHTLFRSQIGLTQKQNIVSGCKKSIV